MENKKALNSIFVKNLKLDGAFNAGLLLMVEKLIRN
jgi:hypothetical protein